MAATLSPAYLRLGGTAADLLWFEAEANHSVTQSKKRESSIETTRITLKSDENEDCWSATDKKGHPVCEDLSSWFKSKPRTNFTMSGQDWDMLSSFAEDTGLTLLFDANALVKHPNGSWDSTNFKSLLDYASKRCKVGTKTAWELGNEPNSLRHALNVTVPPRVLGRAFGVAQALLHSYEPFRNALMVGPDVNAIGKCLKQRRRGIRQKVGTEDQRRGKRKSKALKYLAKFLDTNGSSIDAVTWHHYYLNGHTAHLKDFTSLRPLLDYQRTIRLMRKFLARKGMQAKPMWIGEGGSAFGGGAKGLSNRLTII